jgi:endonuclease/exonuclease/phosphatase (EEP) superfamily protein YafD
MDIKLQFRSVTGLLLVAAVATTLALVAGFFGSLHPAFDSFAHFRIHLAIVLIVLAAALITTSFRRQGLMAMVFGLSAIASVLGWSPRPGAVHAAFQPKPEAGPTYRLLQLNLRLDNWDPGKVLTLIRRVQPDVITLEEFSADWATRLAALEGSHPHRLLCYQAADDGVAILSRHPFGDSRAAACFQNDAMAIAALDLDGRQLDIAAVHLAWPWPFDQSRQIDDLGEPLGSLAGTAILSGDLNAVYWSAAADRVRRAGDFAQIAPVGATWLYYQLPDWLRLAGLPIDQVLTKGNVTIHSARTLEIVGSDHLPVLIEFSLSSTAE